MNIPRYVYYFTKHNGACPMRSRDNLIYGGASFYTDWLTTYDEIE